MSDRKALARQANHAAFIEIKREKRSSVRFPEEELTRHRSRPSFGFG